jgi:hypothetical protein
VCLWSPSIAGIVWGDLDVSLRAPVDQISGPARY